MGKIEKVYSGFVKEMLTDADSFSIECKFYIEKEEIQLNSNYFSSLFLSSSGIKCQNKINIDWSIIFNSI